MAGLEDSMFNDMLDTLGTTLVSASLHTADPGGDGSSEVSGGSYARQSIAWNTAASGSVSVDAAVVFQVPGSTTVTHIGFWDNGPTWRGSSALSSSETFSSDGELTVDPVTWNLNNA